MAARKGKKISNNQYVKISETSDAEFETNTKLDKILTKLIDHDNDKVDALRFLRLHINGDINYNTLIKRLKK